MMLNQKYKTTLCRNFEMNGVCHMAAKCHFAHGKEDLKNITDFFPANTPYITDPKKFANQHAMAQNGQNKLINSNYGSTIQNVHFKQSSNMNVNSFLTILMKDQNCQNQVTIQQLNYLLQELDT